MPESTPPSILPVSGLRHPTLREAAWVWLKIGLISFGGPTGQIALMQQELVEKRRWVSDGRFLHALNYCMILPGPEAQQLAIYIGWLLHRTWGGLVAGVLFVVPGALLMAGISVIYVTFGDVPEVEAVFNGLKPAVIAIVAAAVLRIGKKTLKSPVLWVIAGGAFSAIFFLHVLFPLIVLGAGLIGWFGGRMMPQWFANGGGHGTSGGAADAAGYVIGDARSELIPLPSVRGALRTVAFWGAVWMAPVVAAWFLFGGTSLLVTSGMFFAKTALVTFGGAYAVLPYVAGQAVDSYGWLSAAQMVDGLGLAETTPGPLILVLQFVGFMAGWHAPGDWPPLVMAFAVAGMTTWTTFLPGFLFIFAGAPFVESSRENRGLNAALSAVTAAVVGVVLNLAVWFGYHVLIPDGVHWDWVAVGAVAVFFWLLQVRKWDALAVVTAGAAFGLAVHFAKLLTV